MRQILTILSNIFQPKSIIFGLALFNFFYIYSKTLPVFQTSGKITFYNKQWYETFDFFYVVVLLIAACLLITGKKWSYLAAMILSGVIVIEGIIQSFRFSFFEVWNYVQKYELDILTQWEIQFILAVIIFSFTLFYFICDFRYKSILK
jgi:hypothetical protein